MVEREPPRVYLKIQNERIIHEVRLHEITTRFDPEGKLEYFFARFEMRHNGERYFFDSKEVDVEYILAEDEIDT